MSSIKYDIHCPRRMVIYAVFDVLDELGGKYEQSIVGDIKASVSLFDKTREYAIAVTELSPDSSILHITQKCPPDAYLQEDSMSLNLLADDILSYIEREKII